MREQHWMPGGAGGSQGRAGVLPHPPSWRLPCWSRSYTSLPCRMSPTRSLRGGHGGTRAVMGRSRSWGDRASDDAPLLAAHPPRRPVRPTLQQDRFFESLFDGRGRGLRRGLRLVLRFRVRPGHQPAPGHPLPATYEPLPSALPPALLEPCEHEGYSPRRTGTVKPRLKAALTGMCCPTALVFVLLAGWRAARSWHPRQIGCRASLSCQRQELCLSVHSGHCDSALVAWVQQCDPGASSNDSADPQTRL